jgi:RNA-directed DNA polymerase
VLDDKRLQAAGASLLHASDAQACLGCRDGYRPGRGAGEAGRALTCALQYGRDGEVVEAESQGVVAHMDHDWLLKRLAWRLAARALLGRIRKWLKAGILKTDGRVIPPATEVAPGGVGSPVVAHVYVHEAVDLWCEQVVTPPCRGAAVIRRSAADRVGACRCRREAAWVSQALPQRLGKFKLEVASAKTRILRVRRCQPGMPRRVTV